MGRGCKTLTGRKSKNTNLEILEGMITMSRYTVPLETPCMIGGAIHSNDVIEVWHGMSTPAVGCGFHATHYAQELFAAHRELVA